MDYRTDFERKYNLGDKVYIMIGHPPQPKQFTIVGVRKDENNRSLYTLGGLFYEYTEEEFFEVNGFYSSLNT